MQTAKEAKHRLLINVTSNILAIIVSTLISLWLTPYLIRHLGLAAYGMIPLVTQVVAYFDLFSTAIRNAVGRFVAIHFNRNDMEQSNTYFNTALFSILMMCVLLLVPVIIFAVQLPAIFKVPAGHETSARWLFLLVAASSFFVATTSPFRVSTLIKHRFDLSEATIILSKLLRLGITVLCFVYFGASLKYVGLGYCGMALFMLFSSMYLKNLLTPKLHIKLKSFKLNAFREMASMSGWMTINQIGTLLYLSTDLIIINLMLGPEQCGLYGPLVLVVTLLSMLGSAVANVFTPIAYEYVAHTKSDDLARHTRRATKFMALLIALPTGLVCGFSMPLLNRWLGPTFAELSPLMCLLVGPWIVNTTVRPMFSIYKGMNKVKVPAIVIVIGGVINVILTILLIKYTTMGLYGAALASMLCLTSKNLFFTPIYTATLLDQPKSIFFKDIILGILMAALVSLVGLGLSKMYDLSSIPRLCAAALPLSVVYLLICYSVAISKEERDFLLSLVYKRGI